MGTNKQKPCKRCDKPAFGTHCRACSFAINPVQQRTGKHVNSVGEFNASGIGGFSAESGIAFPKRIEPQESGWVGKSREEFRQWVEQNQRRMTRGSGANWRPDTALTTWTY